MTKAVLLIYYYPDKTTLDRLSLYSKMFDKVLIYDNTPIDNNDYLATIATFSNVEYYTNSKNDGLSIALSYSFNWAIANSFDVLLTMDQDSVISETSILEMFQYIESCDENDIAIYSMNYAKLYIDSKGDFIHDKLKQDVNTDSDVSFSMTSGSYFNVRYLSYVVDLPNLFIGFVDQDICIRLLQSGLKIRRVGNSFFYQQIGTPVRYTKYNRLLQVVHLSDVRYYYMFRNSSYIMKQHRGNFASILRDQARLLINVLVGEKHKLAKLTMIINGYKDFISNVYGEFS